MVIITNMKQLLYNFASTQPKIKIRSIYVIIFQLLNSVI